MDAAAAEPDACIAVMHDQSMEADLLFLRMKDVAFAAVRQP